MRLIPACIFFLSLCMAQTAHADYKSDLLRLAQSIRKSEIHMAEMEKQLQNLEEQQKTITDDIRHKRYETVKNLHPLQSRRNDRFDLSLLTNDVPFIKRYQSYRLQQGISDAMRIRIKQSVNDYMALEHKISSIKRLKRDHELLDLTVQASIKQLEDIAQSRHRETRNKEFAIIIEDLKRQNRTLNAFIKNALNIPDTSPSFEVSSDFILPVSGIVEKIFPSPHAGINIRGRSGALVTSPAAGRVIFADIFKRMGLVVIIDHGNGYTSVMRGFSSIYIDHGFSITQNEPIGHLSKENTGEKGNGAIFYYELRYNNKAINPLEKLSGT